ncbi:MAG TPA: prolipoprotein diacylglyceryl transferase [Saprospiraceae bacterium]|nr:prolipoprotein diacylglyceryl transferase [Saprospiraceae bacterium]
MFPDLSYILHAIFGTAPDNAFSIVKTFGFLLFLSFLASGYLLYLELIRKEKNGQLKGRMELVTVYRPIDWTEIAIQVLINSLFAAKFVYIYQHFKEVNSDPAQVIFSTKGNWIIGAVVAALTAAYWIYKMNLQTDKEIKKSELFVRPVNRLYEITGLAALWGIIGSKLFSILENFGDFVRDPIGTFFSGSGLTIYGGLILAFIMVYRYVKSKGLHPVHMMDAIAPTLMIGYAVGRMGCHLSGDGDWGVVNELAKPSWFIFPDSWWAFDYPHNVINEGIKIEGCTYLHCSQLSPKVFPTPLYESLLAFIITGFLWLLRSRILVPGVLFFIYCLLNGIERITIESIRVNPRYQLLGFNPSFAQIIAFGLIILGTLGIIYCYKRNTDHQAKA